MRWQMNKTEFRKGTHGRCRLRYLAVLSILALFILPGYSEGIKIATWNLLNFPGSTGSSREIDFRKVVDQLGLDILIVQEMTSYEGINEFKNNVMNYSSPGKYGAATFYDGPDTDNEAFYNKATISLISQSQIPTSLRDISEYLFEIKTGPGTGLRFRIYSAHLKAGTTADDKNERAQEATVLRNYLNNLPTNSYFLVCGDFNMESSNESAFGILAGNQSDNDGRVKDPINKLGDWYNNSAFANLHTQSTRTIQFGGGASGGLDDRFDLILISYALDGANDLIYKQGSYFAYGNDGRHLNRAVNDGTNEAVNSEIANALYEASDHLPVVIEIEETKTIETHALTIVSGTGGITVPSPGIYQYGVGTQVAVTAIPDAFYKFAYWTGNVANGHESDNPLSITMDSDKLVAANFLRVIYPPLQLAGQIVINRSVSQAEYINVITWNPNPNNANIVGYRIRQIEGNSEFLIAEVNSATYKFLHRKVEKNKTYTYSIVAVNNDSREGDPAYVTIR
jgi:endonuclease/exonuclease/phosphatase family metal-dependent hydrolase